MVENREFVDNMEARTADSTVDLVRDVIAEQITSRTDIVEGMEARDSNNEFVGGVSVVRPTHFLLDRPMARDVWVPYSAVVEIIEDRVMLSVADLNDMRWENPPLLGNPVV